jgi:hypothetical protein
MATPTQPIFIDEEKRNLSTSSFEKDHGTGTALENIDKFAERAYGMTFRTPTTTKSDLLVRKLDFYLLPFLSLMYFFNSVDRSNLGNAKTDGMDKDLQFKGEQYSLLILLFYIPNGLCDLPLNMLTKKWSGRVMLPSCEFQLIRHESKANPFSNGWLGCDGAIPVCRKELRWDPGHSSAARRF